MEIGKLKVEMGDLYDLHSVLDRDKANKEQIEERIKEIETSMQWVANDAKYFKR